MQKEFLLLVEELENECKAYFAERLISAYIHGSVDKQDAIYGVSDLDYYLVVSGDISSEDIQWQGEITEQLQHRYDAVDEIHLTVQSVEGLMRDSFTRFILSYNATLRMGNRIESIPEYQHCQWVEPDKHLAKMRLSFAQQCFKDALSRRKPECTGEIPKNTYYAARKLARYFVIIEGAYFLMTRNRFCGFDKESVLSGLREEAIAFQDVLDMVASVLENPVRAQIDQDIFLEKTCSLIEWMFHEIQIA